MKDLLLDMTDDVDTALEEYLDLVCVHKDDNSPDNIDLEDY